MKLTSALVGVLMVTAALAPGGQRTAASQPNLTSVKAEFIPGDKVILFDDFSDMNGDDPPPQWKVRGGAFELRVAPDVRQLTTTTEGTMTANLTDLPANFTVEADVKFDNPPTAGRSGRC